MTKVLLIAEHANGKLNASTAKSVSCASAIGATTVAVFDDKDNGVAAQAAALAEVVVLATPWDATEAVVDSLGDLSGKILVDCTNPLTADLSGLAVGADTSGGEEVGRWAAGARVVKAFNTTGSGNMADAGYGGEQLAMLIAGDDAEAKAVVAGLAEELGFEAIDAGPLARSRQLEQLAVLWIALAYQQGLGMDFGFALLRRPG